jgi:transposase
VDTGSAAWIENQTMPKTHKPYDEEFRAGALELLRTGGRPLRHVARELGVSDSSLRKWRDNALGVSAGGGRGAVGDEAAPGASAKELWDENQRLRHENEYLRRQREILKKAASILAEDPRPGMP